MNTNIINTLNNTAIETIKEAMASYKNIEEAKAILNGWTLGFVNPTNNDKLKEEDTITTLLEGHEVRLYPVILNQEEDILAQDMATGKEVNFFHLFQDWLEDEDSSEMGVELFTPTSSTPIRVYKDPEGWVIAKNDETHRLLLEAPVEDLKQVFYGYWVEKVWKF